MNAALALLSPCPERLHWTRGTTTINTQRVPAGEENHVVVIHGQVWKLFRRLFMRLCCLKNSKKNPTKKLHLKRQKPRLSWRLFFFFVLKVALIWIQSLTWLSFLRVDLKLWKRVKTAWGLYFSRGSTTSSKEEFLQRGIERHVAQDWGELSCRKGEKKQKTPRILNASFLVS